MLLTRSPLSPRPKPRFSLDLHVLSAPPAFVLSQDQTLREENMRPHRKGEDSSSVLSLNSNIFPLGTRGRRVHFLTQAMLDERSPREVSTFHAVEFSKTTPLCGNKKTSDSHQRPSRTEHNGRIRSLEGSPVVELQASCTLLPEGRGMVAQEVLVSTKPFSDNREFS